MMTQNELVTLDELEALLGPRDLDNIPEDAKMQGDDGTCYIIYDLVK